MADTDYVVTAQQIIQEAYEQLTVLQEGETVNSDQIDAALFPLRGLIHEYQQEFNVFAMRETFLFLAKTKYEYKYPIFRQEEALSSGGTDFITAGETGNPPYLYDYNTTAIDAASSGATNITASDASISLTTSHIVGIPLDGDVYHWTYVTSGGNTFTINEQLTDDVDTSRDMIYSSSPGLRPLSISSASLRNFETLDERPIEVVSIDEYSELTPKDSSGEVNQIMYHKHLASGDLRTWPAPDTWKKCLVLWVHVPTQTITSSTNFNTDTNAIGFPQEWYWTLAINLARRLIPKTGCPAIVAREIRAMAQEANYLALANDHEDGFFIQPDHMNRG